MRQAVRVDASTLWTALGAGVGAGFVVSAVGAGSLVSFPMLLSIGMSPVAANVTNTVGLVPGGITGSFGFRRELAGHGAAVRAVAATSAAGALVGALFLLVAPESVFDAAVPWLILFAATLVGVQPLISRGLAARGRPTDPTERMSWPREEVDARLLQIMQGIHAACLQHGQRPDGSVSYIDGANVAGFVKVADAMLAQGVI